MKINLLRLFAISQQNVRRKFCVIRFCKKQNVKNRLYMVMLKNACTPADFSFFIFHFSFKVVPLQPNSENPMHSTPGWPVIDGKAGGRM